MKGSGGVLNQEHISKARVNRTAHDAAFPFLNQLWSRRLPHNAQFHSVASPDRHKNMPLN